MPARGCEVPPSGGPVFERSDLESVPLDHLPRGAWRLYPAPSPWRRLSRRCDSRRGGSLNPKAPLREHGWSGLGRQALTGVWRSAYGRLERPGGLVWTVRCKGSCRSGRVPCHDGGGGGHAGLRSCSRRTFHTSEGSRRPTTICCTPHGRSRTGRAPKGNCCAARTRHRRTGPAPSPCIAGGPARRRPPGSSGPVSHPG